MPGSDLVFLALGPAAARTGDGQSSSVPPPVRITKLLVGGMAVRRRAGPTRLEAAPVDARMDRSALAREQDPLADLALVVGLRIAEIHDTRRFRDTAVEGWRRRRRREDERGETIVAGAQNVTLVRHGPDDAVIGLNIRRGAAVLSPPGSGDDEDDLFGAVCPCAASSPASSRTRRRLTPTAPAA